MKKYLAMLCATMLCVCCLGLAACGGGASSSGAASGTASDAASDAASSAASSAEGYVGTWKLAAMEMQGVAVTGDLSAVTDQDLDMQIVLDADGTGVISLDEDSVDLTWEESGDGITATMKQDASEELDDALADSDDGTLDFVLEDDLLKMIAETDDGTGAMLFSEDGQLPGQPAIDVSAAAPITSEDQLIGTWNMSGLNMVGMMAYGDSEALAAMAGGQDLTITFEAGGVATIGGSQTPYTVSEDGAALTGGEALVGSTGSGSDISIPIMALDDDHIIVDLSSVIGMDMAMMYSK